MQIRKIRTLIYLSVIIAFLMPDYCGAFLGLGGPVDSDTKELVEEAILNKSVTILPQLNKLNVGFGRNGDIEYYFTKTVSTLFFQDKPIKAEVIDIDFDGDEITLELSHDILGPGKIKYYFKEDALQGVKASIISELLLLPLSDDNLSNVFCNKESKTYHLYTCNHLPNRDQSIAMKIQEAEGLGYKRCGFCFERMIYVPDIVLEHALAREGAAELRYYSPILAQPEKQAYVQQLGESILAKWPFKLIGYNYTFQLVASPYVNAYALPAGKIFITSALFDSVESEEELKAILIHEIAHVEKRHVLNTYMMRFRQIQGAAMAGIFAGAIAGVAASKGNYQAAATLGSTLLLLRTIVFQIYMFGYEREFEVEADRLLALYFRIHEPGNYAVKSFFKKFQFKNLCAQGHPDVESYTYPLLEDRIHAVEATQFSYFGKGQSFLCPNAKQYPVQLDFEYQSIFEDESLLSVYISDFSLIKDFRRGFGRRVLLEVTDGNHTRTFKLMNDHVTQDVWGAHLAFEERDSAKRSILLTDVDKVSLIMEEEPDAKGERLGGQRREAWTFSKGGITF